MDGSDIYIFFLGVSLTLPFVRGDSKFEMGHKKYPLDVREWDGQKACTLKNSIIICTKCNFSFPNMMPHLNPK